MDQQQFRISQLLLLGLGLIGPALHREMVDKGIQMQEMQRRITQVREVYSMKTSEQDFIHQKI